MNILKPTLILSAFALSATLALSAPTLAAEGHGARGADAGNGRFVEVRDGRGRARGSHRRPSARHGDRARGHRGHFRRYGKRDFRGHFRHGHRSGHRHFRGHRRFRHGHRPYWWHPRYGRSYGYGYGYLGHGAGFVIRLH